MKRTLLLTIFLAILIVLLGCNKKEMNTLTKVSKNETTISAENSEPETESKKEGKKYEYSYFKTKEQEQREKERTTKIKNLSKQDIIKKLQADSLYFKPDKLSDLHKKYVVQLSCIKDKKRLEQEQQKLSKYGYETNISQRNNIDGTIYYRLRLNGKFTEIEATRLGDEIKNKFLNITDYIVLRVN